MTDQKRAPHPALHLCPVCQCPQTKIQRKLDGDRLGATIFVCARKGQCAVAHDLSKVETWVAV